MAGILHPMKGVSIKEVEQGFFLFRFFHKLDVQRILKRGPWSFDGHLLVLGVIKEGESPSQVPLYTVPFWVQEHNIPAAFMTFAPGQNIGNYLGEFLEYNNKNNLSFWRKYMRLRVLINVRKPLKRTKKIRKPGGEAKEVAFKSKRRELMEYLLKSLAGNTILAWCIMDDVNGEYARL
ncbi:hypothetical protein D0Y65_011191 [Glycine soja]|uniref:DUF4283 domain-containing protein n=2 Tax=Glycine subgen. Soja TaxID=1462606 RepID=A0A0R0K1D5_SOYBN|nr:hypothetical protein JHK87_011594 [Glycine soja]RZC10826.1 hypothetical protein D0Y65_011191 [Glycine soja]